MEEAMQADARQHNDALELTPGPERLIDEIDEKYREFKQAKMSRFSVEWGKWSRAFNLILKEVMEDHPEYRHVFIYWNLRSQLLELHYRTPSFMKRGKKRRLSKECQRLRELIVSGDIHERITKADMIRMVLGR